VAGVLPGASVTSVVGFALVVEDTVGPDVVGARDVVAASVVVGVVFSAPLSSSESLKIAVRPNQMTKTTASTINARKSRR
jgi:hypothetical protein